MRSLSVCLLVILACAVVTQRTGRHAAASQQRHSAPPIAVVGDSVAYGAYDVVRGGWVTRLERLLAADYPKVDLRILNAAGNGGTFADLSAALRWVHRHAHPSLVIVAYGLNDFDEHIASSVLVTHLRAGLQMMRAWTPRPAVVLMGMPPITALSPARLRLERAYTDAIRHTAAAEHAGYLDEFDLWLALGPRYLHTLRHDTEHPNRFGYSFTAATVAAFLEGAYLDGQGHIHPPASPPTCSVSVCGS